MEFDNDIFSDFEKDVIRSYEKAIEIAKMPIKKYTYREIFCKLTNGTYRRGTLYDFELDFENKTIKYFHEIIPFSLVATFSCPPDSHMSISEYRSLYEEQLLKSSRG